MRPAGRSNNQVRPVTLTRNYTKHAEGSVLVEFGDTKVLCTASIEEGVPRFLKGQGQGWITAEYGMLPRSTHTRNARWVSSLLRWTATCFRPMVARVPRRLRVPAWRWQMRYRSWWKTAS
mgnify:CR=1 FL=1